MTVRSLERDFVSFAESATEGGPQWLPALRRVAMDRFIALGFPTPKNEDWHFTSVSPIAESEFVPAPDGSVELSELEPYRFGPAEWPRLVFVNGRFTPGLSTLDALPAGVRALPLARAWHESPELLHQHLARTADYEATAFTALNTAFMTDGAIIDIAPNSDIATPIQLLFVMDESAAQAVAHPRTLILMGHHARATIIESYGGLCAQPYLTNAVTEIELGEGATLHHLKVQREGGNGFHVGTSSAHQARDSHYISFSFATGASLSRTNIYTVLDGDGAGSTLNGLYMVDGEQHVDHQTRIEHARPNCFSRELYKGLLDGSSHGVFNGKVYVQPEAQKTDGKQSNNNLLLSDRARVDTKPQLEIYADDVKCTHGATVGRLDETALFYLKSRGIPADKARRLLTYAFAAEVLEQIESEPVRTALEDLALRRFTDVAETAVAAA